jgi:hypothetical protein
VWPTMAESIAKLYRGVSRAMYDRGDGLKPRGTRAKRGITYGDGHRYDDGSQYGETDDNGVWQHQQGQSPYLDSAWLSTTPHFEMAKKYALYSSVEGVVYEIEPDRFPALGVKDVDRCGCGPFPSGPRKCRGRRALVVSNTTWCLTARDRHPGVPCVPHGTD